MGRYLSPANTAGSVVKTISANGYTASVNDRIYANSTSAAFSITLPSSNTTLDGDSIQVIDINGTFGTNNVTLLRSGTSLPNIMGQAADLVLNVNYTSITLTFSSAAGWIITGH